MRYNYYKQVKNGHETLVKCQNDTFIQALNSAKRNTKYQKLDAKTLTNKQKRLAKNIPVLPYDFAFDVYYNDSILARMTTLHEATLLEQLLKKSNFYYSDVDNIFHKKILIVFLESGFSCEYEVTV